MIPNVGSLDRLLRAIVGIALIVLPFATAMTAGSALLTYGAVAVGVVLVLTALTRMCPLYSVFGIRTCAQ